MHAHQICLPCMHMPCLPCLACNALLCMHMTGLHCMHAHNMHCLQRFALHAHACSAMLAFSMHVFHINMVSHACTYFALHAPIPAMFASSMHAQDTRLSDPRFPHASCTCYMAQRPSLSTCYMHMLHGSATFASLHLIALFHFAACFSSQAFC